MLPSLRWPCSCLEGRPGLFRTAGVRPVRVGDAADRNPLTPSVAVFQAPLAQLVCSSAIKAPGCSSRGAGVVSLRCRSLSP
jgi:hypothetical protein